MKSPKVRLVLLALISLIFVNTAAAQRGYASAGESDQIAEDVSVYLPAVFNLVAGNHPPVTPFNPTPPNGMIGQPTEVDLTWAGGDPDGDTVFYDVYFTADDNTPEVLLCKDSAPVICDPGTLNYNTHYYWRVIARDEHGATTGGPVWDFATGPDPEYYPPPDAPAVPSPAAGATAQPPDVDLSWVGDSDEEFITYDVHFAADDETPDAVLCDDITVTFCDPGTLEYGTHYFWQVIASVRGSSTAGPVWDFTTNNLPSAPSAPEPADGATGQPVDLDLRWTGGDPDGDEVTYDVYFVTGDGTPDDLLCADAPTATCDPGTLAYGTHYYWQVVATDEHGASADGPVWEFTTNALPTVPSLPAPAHGSTGQPLDTDLTWSGGDPDGDSVTYDVYFAAGDDTPDVLVCDDAGSTTCDPGVLNYGTQYYWQVVATDGQGATATGSIWTFTTEAICVPSLISPAEGEVLDNGRSDFLDLIEWDFDWSDCASAASYHLYVIGESASLPIIDVERITASNYHHESIGYIAPRHAEGWHWKVRASRDGQWGAWSEVRTFDVEPMNTDPPYNDDFDSPVIIGATPYARTQNTASTTTAIDDPVFSCAAGQGHHTVWYRFTAPVDGVLSVNTLGSSYDTILAAWTGSRGDLSWLVCYDDSGGGSQSAFNLVVTGGTTYFIEVASAEESVGTLSLEVNFTADSGP